MMPTMEKDFDRWNDTKKDIHASMHEVYFYEREVWWVHLGVNIGFEQDGTGEVFERPVVIVKKYNPDVFLAVPLSTTQKIGKYYFHVGEVEGKQATAILSQIRLLDVKRLINRAGTLNTLTFDSLVDALVEANFKNVGKSSSPPLAGRG
ncbi:type II toxin-antitoxin system PemK/MazF family toxin [Candidatus Kaiserbacteria bacterium]|nr:type II toxin-antitoxin system PemK/MazF family toxin [Candidatus Kaiserbacteria bacterium]